MSTPTPDRHELEQRWRTLPTPTGDALSGSPARPGPPLVYVAADTTGTRHLLIETTQSISPTRPARGLELQSRELALAGTPLQTWLDLVCTSPAGHSAFTALTRDVLEALPASTSGTADGLQAVLKRWRWFWTADTSHLINGGAVGLIGELWFLLRWLSPVNVATLQHWHGPARKRHDFASPTVSVEVKATASRPPGGATHRIGSLEQLDDPETGQLHLFSLQLARDELAGTSLTGLVDQLLDSTSSDAAAADLAAERLAAAGWSPAHADQHRSTYRVLAEELYEVRPDFPRLTSTSFSDGLPAGIATVSYDLSLAACRPWRLATSPAVDLVEGLRSA